MNSIDIQLIRDRQKITKKLTIYYQNRHNVHTSQIRKFTFFYFFQSLFYTNDNQSRQHIVSQKLIKSLFLLEFYECSQDIHGFCDDISYFSMSQQQPKAQVSEQPQSEPQIPAEQPMSPQEQQAYNKMMSTLSKMNKKIETVKSKLVQEEHINQKKTKTDQITQKLITSKQSSQIITKENLLSDITESYEKVVIEVYSENSKLKKKIDEMAKLIKQQSNKIYEHTRKQSELVKQNEQLRLQLAKMKDQRLMMARGMVNNPVTHQGDKEASTTKKKANNTGQNNTQNQDFDFWSMPQNDYGKKKKDFVQNSNLWVNQKDHQGVFLTQDLPTGNKKKK